METKEKILSAALSLFNDYGIERVTTRDIAGKAGISQGNMLYHFKKKEFIIEVLFDNFIKAINQAAYFYGTPLSPQDVFNSMCDSFKIMYEYRFLVLDRDAVWRRVPNVMGANFHVLETKKNQILQLISLYNRSDVLRNDLSEDQLTTLADQFVFVINTWIHGLTFLEGEATELPHVKGARFVFRFWLPYISQAYIKEWEDVIIH